MLQKNKFTLDSDFCRTQVVFSALQYCKPIHFYVTFCKKHHFEFDVLEREIHLSMSTNA